VRGGIDVPSINLEEVILRHGGEAQAAREAFAQLPEGMREAVLRFLESLVLFPPDDTASNLDPGGISLRVLFNDASDPE
jgi:di-heme oxidoreductase (putative peroxidase)